MVAPRRLSGGRCSAQDARQARGRIMMPLGAEYPFVIRDPGRGVASLAPLLPLTLVGANSVSLTGFLDTGAAVNVLPYSISEQLGAVWTDPHPLVELTGNLARHE